MRETYEFRCRLAAAKLLFNATEIKDLGGVAVVRVESSDSRLSEIGTLHKKMLNRNDDEPFFWSWEIVRSYTRKEINASALLLMKITTAFEPAGEECGTIYDQDAACRECGAGARQIGPLRLGPIGLKRDFARTIADEVIVTDRVAEIIASEAPTVLVSEIMKGRSADSMKGRKQLRMEAPLVDIHPRTRVGVNPFDFDEKGEFRCKEGDTIGLNLLSEVVLKKINSRNSGGMFFSRQFVGALQGLLRPTRLIFITPHLLSLFESSGVKGFRIERALIE